MVQDGIIVPASEQQKKNFEEIGTKTPRQKFLQEIRDFEKECVRKFIPFDFTCAKMDYEDKLDESMRELNRTHGNQSWGKREINVNIGDLNEYVGSKRFKLVKKYTVKEMITIGNHREPQVTKMRFEYICPRSHRLSMDIPMFTWGEIKDEFNEEGFRILDKKTKKKEEVKDAKETKV